MYYLYQTVAKHQENPRPPLFRCCQVLQSAPDGIKWTDRAVVDGANGFVSTEFDPPVLTQWVRVAWRFSMGVFTWVWQGLVDKIQVPKLRNTNGICNILSHHTPHPKNTHQESNLKNLIRPVLTVATVATVVTVATVAVPGALPNDVQHPGAHHPRR